MKIAQVSPLFESVPPKAYGGTERVVSYLTEELVAMGCDVTLFASADSTTRARLVPAAASLRAAGQSATALACHTLQLGMLASAARSFDIIHFHTDYLQFPMARGLATAHVSTLHGRLDLPELAPLYRHFLDMPVVSISNSQRAPLPWINWQGTVHHGLPPGLYDFNPAPDNTLLFLGRISPEKRPDRAIEIAVRSGMPLTIAAKVDPADSDYFAARIAPLLRHPLVHFIGEVEEAVKRRLLSSARALLMPIDWPEPFGLVMIEAFACGTPVIAYRRGSVPEIVTDGVTGFIVDDQEQAVQAVSRLAGLDRQRCRQAFLQRFTARRMAQAYLRLYERLQQQAVQKCAAQPTLPAGAARAAAVHQEHHG